MLLFYLGCIIESKIFIKGKSFVFVGGFHKENILNCASILYLLIYILYKKNCLQSNKIDLICFKRYIYKKDIYKRKRFDDLQSFFCEVIYV